MNHAQIQSLVANEARKIRQSALLQALSDHLVEPREELRDWDYGKPGERYPCWIIAEHPRSNTGIAYCAEGFGPAYPWGLLFIEGPHQSIGPDSGWFASLEDAVRESMIWDGENPVGYEVS